MKMNVRNLSGDFSGVQRYTSEILERIPAINVIGRGERSGFLGHMWEQCSMPFKMEGELLWSPANTGPLSYSHQVLTLHDISPLDYPEWFDKRYAYMNKLILPILTRRVQRIITVSEYSRRNIIEKLMLPVSKVVSIPLAADERFKPLVQEEKILYRKKNNWPEKYILTVGSLEPRKNLKTLLLAWENWNNRPKELKLLIAGGQGKVFSGIGFDKVPDDVILLGRISDELLPSLYSCAKAFVFPSIYEGFGLPPLEAMSSGTPVIVSNTTSLPEVVGDSALLFNPFDFAELIEKLDFLVRHQELQDELKEKGLQRSLLFNWEKTAELTRQILVNEEK